MQQLEGNHHTIIIYCYKSIDKYTEIERENRILFEKMINITNRTPFYKRPGKLLIIAKIMKKHKRLLLQIKNGVLIKVL